MRMYSEMKKNAKKSDNVMQPQTGIRRIIGQGGKAENMLILNVNDPKPIPSINLDIFYVKL